jgi:hypothetical protein
MNFCSPSKFSLMARKSARSVIALLVLLSLLLACMPIPIGLKPRVLPGTQAFPCQSCHCGCSTPEQCWTNCCCYSPAEREAWAVRNGVEPPAYAVLADSIAVPLHRVDKPLANPSCAAGRSCCGEGADCSSWSPTAGAEMPQLSSTTSVPLACPNCNAASGSGDMEATPNNEPEVYSESIVVLSLAAIQCRGGSSQLTLLPWAIIQQCDLHCFFPEPIVAPFEMRNDWFPSLASAPAVPPPRS